MNIKITKQLKRPDTGIIAANSIANCNPILKEESLTVMFPITLFVSQAAQDSKIPITSGCSSFPQMRLKKVCDQAEWDKMNDDAGAGALVTGWYQTAIDDAIGVGNTVVIV